MFSTNFEESGYSFIEKFFFEKSKMVDSLLP